jgi:hypothetical protein
VVAGVNTGKSNMNKKRSIALMALVVLAIALAVNLAVAWKLGLNRPMESDAHYFREIAENIAAGRGFRQTGSLWMDTPTMTRLPGWPFAVALAMKTAPVANPDMVMRLTATAVNSTAAVLVALLTIKLLGRPAVGLLAGLAYALHPTGIYSTYTGLSEPLFVLCMVGGVLLLLANRTSANLAGFALVGLACLVRANYVIWGVVAAAVVGWMVWRKAVSVDRRMVAVGMIGLVVTVLPMLAWAGRNYNVCGRFPVVSSLQGEVLYGGNNQVVATNRHYWGYWVFPDAIPGETPKAILAGRMSECEVNQYYRGKANVFIRSNLAAMPMLWLGKLVRAFVPVPWNLTVETAVVSVYRWVLYLASIVGIVLLWRVVDVRYNVAVMAMLAVTVITVLWFWGCARFAFAAEPFLIPFAAGAVTWRRWQTPHPKAV